MFLRADKLHKHGTKRPQNDWSLQIHERFHIEPVIMNNIFTGLSEQVSKWNL